MANLKQNQEIAKIPTSLVIYHDDVIKWRHFSRHWPFVRGIHQSPVNTPHISQWRGAFMFSLICVRINGCVNNCEAGDLRRIRPHYDVKVMFGQKQAKISMEIVVSLYILRYFLGHRFAMNIIIESPVHMSYWQDNSGTDTTLIYVGNMNQ